MKIIYQDEFLVAIDKPAGLLVHRSELDKGESRFALQELRDTVGQFVYPIHRLDKPTSGALLFGLQSDITAQMSLLFREGDIEKKYLAVVRGYTYESATIDSPLRKIIDTYGRPAYKSDEAQEATTLYKRLATCELPVSIDKYPTSRYSLLELTPKTGRRHQLRRHMKKISHPIIGDPKYGKSKHNNYFKDALHVPRLLLASVSLKFVHPITKSPIEIHSLPEDSFASMFPLFDFDVNQYQP